MASGTDIANLTIASATLLVSLLLYGGVLLSTWILEYLNRHLEGFLNMAVISGPGTPVLEMYYKLVPPAKRVDPSDENFGNAVMEAIGTMTTAEGRRILGSAGVPMVDTVPVSSLVAVGKYLSDLGDEVEVLEDAILPSSQGKRRRRR